MIHLMVFCKLCHTAIEISDFSCLHLIFLPSCDLLVVNYTSREKVKTCGLLILSRGFFYGFYGFHIFPAKMT